jgi:hypothetical protein
MNWIKENKPAALIILVLAVGLIYAYSTKQSSSVVSQFDKKVDLNNSLEKNLTLENVYKNSTQLPEHNTVCFPVKKLLCNGGVCESAEPKVFNLLIASSENTSLNPAYARCDSDGCNVYDSRSELSGGYVNIQPLDPNGMMLKMSLTDSKYVEVATLGLDMHISYGYCVSKSKEI